MDSIAAILLWLAAMGPWTPVVFVIGYIVASIVLAPAFLLALAAGAVLGLWRGVLVIYIGALLGSSAVYVLASRLARARVVRWIDREPRASSVRRAVTNQSLWVMFLLRLSPVVPYVLLNYALAVSGVRYRDFALASVGMLPTITLYVYYGKVVGDVTKVAAGVAPPKGPEYYAVVAAGLVATELATRAVTRAARRAIAAERASGEAGHAGSGFMPDR
jgi:uncharacterized membrane protein YdjX (TVP38/TMEM64 family)